MRKGRVPRAYTDKYKERKERVREKKKARAQTPHKLIGRGDRVALKWEKILKDADLWQDHIDPGTMKELEANRIKIIASRQEITGITLGRAGERQCWNVAMESSDGKIMNAIFFEMELRKIED